MRPAPKGRTKDGRAAPARAARRGTAAGFAEAESEPTFTLAPLPGVPLGEASIVLVHGPPGAGKSTLALQLLDAIEGPVLAYLAEEADSATVRRRFARLGIRRPDFHTLADAGLDVLEGELRDLRPRALLIDSIHATKLAPPDLRRLVRAFELRALVGVAQVNKQSEMAGLRAWDHIADARLSVSDGRWQLEKSREVAPPLPGGEVRFTAERAPAAAPETPEPEPEREPS